MFDPDFSLAAQQFACIQDADLFRTVGCGSDASDTTGPTGQGIFFRNSQVWLADVTDGASNTILVGERAWSNANGTWAGAVPGGVIRRGRYNPCQPP